MAGPRHRSHQGRQPQAGANPDPDPNPNPNPVTNPHPLSLTLTLGGRAGAAAHAELARADHGGRARVHPHLQPHAPRHLQRAHQVPRALRARRLGVRLGGQIWQQAEPLNSGLEQARHAHLARSARVARRGSWGSDGILCLSWSWLMGNTLCVVCVHCTTGGGVAVGLFVGCRDKAPQRRCVCIAPWLQSHSMAANKKPHSHTRHTLTHTA